MTTKQEIETAAKNHAINIFEGHVDEYTLEDCFEEDELYGNYDPDESFKFTIVSNVRILNCARLESVEPDNANIYVAWVSLVYNLQTEYDNAEKEEEDIEETERPNLILILDKKDLGLWKMLDVDYGLEEFYIPSENDDEDIEIELDEKVIQQAIEKAKNDRQQLTINN